MKKSFFAIVAALLLIQVGMLFFVYGSPVLAQERALTPTPSATPMQAPTATARPTPIPTLIPVGLGAPTQAVSQASFNTGQCAIAALDLIGAWVKAGKPEKDLFNFTSNDNKVCLGAFDQDVLPLFTQPNIWYSGALACTACHNKNLSLAAANMSVADYRAILAGSRRKDDASAGQDILGDATSWEKSKLYVMITNRVMPMGRPATSPEKGPVVKVGAVRP